MNTAVQRKATRREWVGLAVIALPCLLYSMDLTVLNLALPRISETLAPSSAELLWIVDIYGFLVAGLLITMGTLGDRIGRRKLLLVGAGAFGVASVLAAFSRSAAMLIAMRAVLGIAGATLAPSTLSLIRNMFLDARQRTMAIGVWTSSYSAGAAVGPLVGGLLLEHFWWGSVFLAGVPVMILLLVVGPVLLPEYRDPAPGPLDPWSAALSLCAVLPVIYGLKQIAQAGVHALPALCIVGGLAVGALFVRRQRTLPKPLIDLGLFRLRSLRASLGTLSLGTFVAFGIFVFIAQYLQLALDLSPLQAGLWTLPWSCGFLAGSLATPIVARHVRPALVIATGFAVAAMGFAIMTRIGGPSSLAVLATSSGIISVAMSPTFTLTTDITVGSAPPERAGAASALSETSSELGGAIGIATFGSIGTAVYRGAMAGALPRGLPSELNDAAQGTFGGAVSAALRLGGPAGTGLLNAARDSFTQATRVVAGVSAAAALLAAAFVAIALRGAPPSAIGEE